MKINGFINGSVTFKQYQILGGFSSFSSWGHFAKKWQPDFGKKNLSRQLGKRDKFGLKTEYFGILKGLTLFCCKWCPIIGYTISWKLHFSEKSTSQVTDQNALI